MGFIRFLNNFYTVFYSENADSSPTKRMSNLNLDNVSKSPKKRTKMVFSSSEESGDEVIKVNREVSEATGKRQQPGYVLRNEMVILSSDASEKPSEETPELHDDSSENEDSDNGRADNVATKIGETRPFSFGKFGK